MADIAAFYRGRADAGEVQALVELGSFLYWDEPQAARAAYQEAIDGGHRPALIDLGMVLAKRVYEVRYLDTSLLAGSAPRLSTTAGVRVGDSWVRLLWRELF